MSAAPTLPALQQRLLQALIAPAPADRASAADWIQPGARIDAAACLDIYRRSYVLRLRRCLAEQFPATRHALGAALFDDFADTYLRDCPSDSTTLYQLGRRYADWLERNRPDRDSPADEREDWIDFLVDLARYERELFHLFDAPGAEDQPWPDASADDSELVLQPCLTLAQYRYPVAGYYHEVRAGRDPAFPPRSDCWVVVLRRDYDTTTFPVSELHFRFLSLVQQQASIDAALQEISAWTGRTLDAVRQSWRADVRRAWVEAGFFLRRTTGVHDKQR
ncbi:putative DNA-binding protein [Tahibacter aquaticus]|uniref:Putative DNA-binding protein n=1 Tax=Tahibacter aquaticus TaxID=520092 RepID=A0A4R6YL68_9GAMM|nr:DNA-binding domain-containing protein [Tahibacter aquaticus]TDR37838.1 putative DNA-binding protein [Tahibacter aquaticus]